MDKTANFFPNGEWSEEAYQQYQAEEAILAWEKSSAPWQTAMRGWLREGAVFPTVMLRFDTRGCALAIYCRGRTFEIEHGFSPCEICPYGLDNIGLFRDLARALGEFRTGEQVTE